MTSRRSFLQSAAAFLSSPVNPIVPGQAARHLQGTAPVTASLQPGAAVIRLVGSFAYTRGTAGTRAYAVSHGASHRVLLVIGEGISVPSSHTHLFSTVNTVGVRDLERVHIDFASGSGDYRVMCLGGWTVATQGSAAPQLPLNVLPNIRDIFQAANGSDPGSVATAGKVAATITLRDGIISKPYPTPAEGHSKDWQFRLGSVDYSDAMSLTDILDVRRRLQFGLTLSHATEGSFQLYIPVDGAAWVVNGPTGSATANPNVLTHGDGFFGLYATAPGRTPQAHTIGIRRRAYVPLKLQCLDELIPMNPPDIEFCYQAFLD